MSHLVALCVLIAATPAVAGAGCDVAIVVPAAVGAAWPRITAHAGLLRDRLAYGSNVAACVLLGEGPPHAAGVVVTLMMDASGPREASVLASSDADAYCVVAAARGGGGLGGAALDVRVTARSARGALYGLGRVWRTAQRRGPDAGDGAPVLTLALGVAGRVCASPLYPVRGHMISYRRISNT